MVMYVMSKKSLIKGSSLPLALIRKIITVNQYKSTENLFDVHLAARS